MPGPIVCCVDDSAHARDAARVGRALAGRLGFNLVLLHVAPPVTQPGMSAVPGAQERLAASERADAQALLEGVARDLGLGEEGVSLRIEIGDPAQGVLAVCEQEAAELVVLGSHGRGGVTAMLLGSVSSRVAAKAPCVAVIVPPGAAERVSFT